MLCNYCGTSEELESEPLLTSASKTPSLADADRSSDKLTITEEWQTRSGQWSSPATPLMVCLIYFTIMSLCLWLMIDSEIQT